MPIIIPSRVKEIREARRLSQDALLAQFERFTVRFQGETNITKRTLQRIEGNTAGTEAIRDGTFNVLAKLLDVDPKVLTGDQPIPDDIIPVAAQNKKPIAPEGVDPEGRIETRLVRLDDKFIIVEFCDEHPTGRVIAREIQDEAAGLRLSQATELRRRLGEAFEMINHPKGPEECFEENFARFNDHAMEPNMYDLMSEWDTYTGKLRLLLNVPKNMPHSSGSVIDELHDAANRAQSIVDRIKKTVDSAEKTELRDEIHSWLLVVEKIQKSLSVLPSHLRAKIPREQLGRISSAFQSIQDAFPDWA